MGPIPVQYDCDCDVGRVDTIGEAPVLTTAWWSTVCVRVCSVRACMCTNIGPMCLWPVACGGSIAQD